eukprot:2473330-Heterocapsa_arctica.AAC.1
MFRRSLDASEYPSLIAFQHRTSVRAWIIAKNATFPPTEPGVSLAFPQQTAAGNMPPAAAMGLRTPLTRAI